MALVQRNLEPKRVKVKNSCVCLHRDGSNLCSSTVKSLRTHSVNIQYYSMQKPHRTGSQITICVINQLR